MISSDIDDTAGGVAVGLFHTGLVAGAARRVRQKIVYRDATIRILKPGNYRMDADTAQLRVHVGEAEVTRTGDGRNGDPVKIEASQLMPLDGAPVVKRFTQGSDGLLDIWSEERGSLIASNLANSQSISDPLLDQDAVPADLASFIGYMPMTTIPTVGLTGISPYGYSYLYPNYLGFSPYTSLVGVAYTPVRPAMRLYIPRYGHSSVGIRAVPVFPGWPLVSYRLRVRWYLRRAPWLRPALAVLEVRAVWPPVTCISIRPGRNNPGAIEP